MADKVITIYTDGACSGNPGPGGWGALLMWNGHEKELFGGEGETTNNRMEMMGAIKALTAIRKRPRSKVVIHSDSNLVVQGMNEWLAGWKAKGWRKSNKKPVENAELWTMLDELSAVHEVRWVHVKGHSGDPGNERADMLANRGADGDNGKRDYQRP